MSTGIDDVAAPSAIHRSYSYGRYGSPAASQVALLLAFGLDLLLYSLVVPFLPQEAKQLGASPITIGILFCHVCCGSVCCHAPGRVAHRSCWTATNTASGAGDPGWLDAPLCLLVRAFARPARPVHCARCAGRRQLIDLDGGSGDSRTALPCRVARPHVRPCLHRRRASRLWATAGRRALLPGWLRPAVSGGHRACCSRWPRSYSAATQQSVAARHSPSINNETPVAPRSRLPSGIACHCSGSACPLLARTSGTVASGDVLWDAHLGYRHRIRRPCLLLCNDAAARLSFGAAVGNEGDHLQWASGHIALFRRDRFCLPL